eukprot:TRINITY_DN2790_c0_g1_i1.p1 TRINITY_DN2790_c0_g1~~TRINITY_DN2790_c0_g1_i1.p1  ORF type:complete len:341 (+),score=46.72 TRINITY_DN2790_c0_g1_i1:457-1479(+)
MYFALITLTNLFPNRTGLLVGLFNSCFDASVVVMALFRVIYDFGHVPIGHIFLVFNVIPVSIFIYSFFWPSLKEVPGKAVTVDESVAEPAKTDDGRVQLDEVELEESTPAPTPLQVLPTEEVVDPYDLTKVGYRKQITSPEFISSTGYMAVGMLFINTYLGTVDVQLQDAFGVETGHIMSYVLGGILPLGLLSVPVVGWLLDKKGFVVSFLVLQGCYLLFCVLSLFYVVPVQVINFPLFTFLRALFFSAAMTYVIQTFGYANFGRIWGTQQVVAGFTNMLQAVLIQMVYEGFDGNYLSMNVTMLIVVLILTYFPVFLFLRKRQVAARALRDIQHKSISSG